jgi:prepilin-type N-terminal cleavage/methylation domain-containing protein
MSRPMNNNRFKPNHSTHKQNKGFSLVELIVGMSITTLIVALASQALISTQNSFTKDQKKVENGQKISSILEIVGREIRQAGELIVDADFPTIKVKQLASGKASLIIYRAISEPVSLCRAYSAGVQVPSPGLLFAVDQVTNNPCKVANVTPYVPSTQQTDWITKRNNAGGQLFGVVNSSGTAQPFTYNSESFATGTNSMNLAIGILPFTPSQPISLNNSVYLVIKKEYMICEDTVTLRKDLMVRVNSNIESTSVANQACNAPNLTTDPTAILDTVATNVSSLDINMITRPTPDTTTPDPAPDNAAGNGVNLEFPTTTPLRNWQNIQGIIVKIKSVDPLASGIIGRNVNTLTVAEKERIEASFSSQGTFYPRNALSSR